MSAKIYLYCPAEMDGPSRLDLEEELETFFGGLATTWGTGLGCFYLAFAIARGQDPHAWADRVKRFLLRFGVPPGSYFEVFPDGWKPGMEWRQVEVFGKDRRRSDPPVPPEQAEPL
jgi:hypothetical protein